MTLFLNDKITYIAFLKKLKLFSSLLRFILYDAYFLQLKCSNILSSLLISFHLVVLHVILASHSLWDWQRAMNIVLGLELYSCPVLGLLYVALPLFRHSQPWRCPTLRVWMRSFVCFYVVMVLVCRCWLPFHLFVAHCWTGTRLLSVYCWQQGPSNTGNTIKFGIRTEQGAWLYLLWSSCDAWMLRPSETRRGRGPAWTPGVRLLCSMSQTALSPWIRLKCDLLPCGLIHYMYR